MRLCIDTNVLLQFFGTSQPYGRIADALQQGRLEYQVTLAVFFKLEPGEQTDVSGD